MRKLAMALTCLMAMSAAGTFALADNQQNCLDDESVVIFSGTDAGAARRGLNAGVVGCNTAANPRDVPTWTDTSILTPGATHAIPAVTGRDEAAGSPGAATFKHQDGSTVSITWQFLNSRWEGQSIALQSGPGTVSVTAIGKTVTYEKVA